MSLFPASLGVIPDVIREVLVAKISLDRLSDYLNSPEVDMRGRGACRADGIALRDAAITWPSANVSGETEGSSVGNPRFTLGDMNVDIPSGELTLISGPLGSGKVSRFQISRRHDGTKLCFSDPVCKSNSGQSSAHSTMVLNSAFQLLGLLGEATVLRGEIIAPRSSPTAIPLPEDPIQTELETDKWLDPTMTAYSPQISYIKHGSIRSNILNGLPFWPKRYSAVLRQCALLPDLELFEHQDLTEVGEQGVTLVSPSEMRTR
jgi:hypothetical protein